MFCRNCGKEIDNLAAVCIHCGVNVGDGTRFCQHCGTQTLPNAVVCTNCGVALIASIPVGEQKSKVAAGILGIFLGYLGIHNFYLGNTGKAVAQLLITVLTCGIGGAITGVWGLIEGILILTGSIATDAKGIPLKN